jgi:ankyrin repeat protein/beta-lactamase regulating signal transducer with metallopeptidase domain
MNASVLLMVSHEAMWWCIRLVFSQTILWVMAGCAVWLLRRSSAAVRHRVWALSVLLALGLPLTVGTCPSIGLGLLEAPNDHVSPEVTQRIARGGRRSTLPAGNPLDVDVLPGLSASSAYEIAAADLGATDAGSGLHARDRVGADNDFWSASWVLVVVVPAFWGLWRTARALLVARRIVTRSLAIADGDCRQTCRSLADALGWRRAVALRQSDDTRVPLCLGLKNPVIVLPADWRQWPQETLRGLIAHELSHIVRRDVAWQLVARLACALYWFQPLVWLAAWRMRVEREYACDDSVLRLGQKPTTYARMLLDVAERLGAETAVPSVAAATVVRSALESRVRAILAKNRGRRAPGGRAGLALVSAMLIAVVAAGTISPFSRTMKSEHAADPHVIAREVALDRQPGRTKHPPTLSQENNGMHDLVASGNITAMQKAVAHDPESVNRLDESGLPPLFTAALYRNRQAIDLLLAHGAVVDIFACGYLGRAADADNLLKRDPALVRATTQNGMTALHYAAMAGHADVVEVLIRYGADVNARDSSGKTPLMEASHGGPWKDAIAEDVVEMLLTHHAEVDLVLAAAIGRTDLLKSILDRDGSLIDTEDERGRTPLYHAVRNNRLDAVKLLVERGADVNRSDMVGIAALHRTSQQCSDELIRYLIDHGANAHLCCYVACGDEEGTRKILMRTPDAVHEVPYEFNAVGYAIHSWQLGTLRILLQYGGTLSDEDKQHILRISNDDRALLDELVAMQK